MKLTDKQRHDIATLFRDIRGSMNHADEAAARLVADTYGVSPADVLTLAFFDQQPPRKPAAAAREWRAGRVIEIRGRTA